MANKFRGEVSFDAGEVSYTLCFTSNSLCELEGELGDMSIVEFLTQLQDPKTIRNTNIRKFFWAGLRARHPDMTQTKAGDIMDADPHAALRAAMKAYGLHYGVEEEIQKEIPQKPGRSSPAKKSEKDGIGLLS